MMEYKFEHPGLNFEVIQKEDAPEIHVHVEASWVTNQRLERRILLTTRKVARILARNYGYNIKDIKVTKEDHVTNLNDNTKEERTGHWIFSLPTVSYEEKETEEISRVVKNYVDNKWNNDENILDKEKTRLKSLSYNQLVEENKLSISEVTNLLNNKITKHPKDTRDYKTQFYSANTLNLLISIDNINEKKKQKTKQTTKRSKSTSPAKPKVSRTSPTLKKPSQRKTRARKSVNLTK